MTPPDFVGGAVGVRVPATSANLGPGFDALGLALGLADTVTVEVTGGGLQIEVGGEGAEYVPRDERHLVVRALRTTFDLLEVHPPGLRLTCINAVPHSRGLGSSAAAIVAGVLAARALVIDGEHRLDDAGVLSLCDRIEGHPDNVAACLLGGLTIAWLDDQAERVRAVRLDPHPDLAPMACVPVTRSSTAAARGVLPAQVPFADAAFTGSRAALLVAALTERPDLLLAATEDRLHQPYRAAGAPASADLVRELRSHGIPAAVSGAGPTVLALPTSATDAALTRQLVPAGFTVRELPVDRRGAHVGRSDDTHGGGVAPAAGGL